MHPACWTATILSQVACMAIGASLTAAGAQDAAAPSQGNGDLRLVVVVVVDQFRGDSLERYQRLFGPDGFRRLCEGGVWYQNAFFDHAHTVTGPGNATTLPPAPWKSHAPPRSVGVMRAFCAFAGAGSRALPITAALD